MIEIYQEKKETLPRRYPFINIVGPVGVGKSTICEELENALQISGIQEPYLDNPYLRPFYKEDKKKYSFLSQMFFLNEDGKETLKIKRTLSQRAILKDAGRDVNLLIATVQWKNGWMTDDEFDTYSRRAKEIYEGASKPEVYVALTAKKETILKRIRDRGREMELSMMDENPGYFPMLVDEFNNWLEKKKNGDDKLIAIDTDKFDFSRDGNLKEMLLGDTISWLNYYLTSSHQRDSIGVDGANLIIPESFCLRPRHITDYAPGQDGESIRLRR